MELRDPTRLVDLMKKHGTTQRQLAQAIGLKSHGYISALVRGQYKNLRAEPALKLAYILDVPIDYLFLTKADENIGRMDEFVPSKARTSK